VRRIHYRYQRTLANPAEVAGVGHVTGVPARVRLRPAPADTGLTFLRTDRKGSAPIPATAASVSDTARRTTLGRGEDSVTLVEHLLAALAGMRVDNCLIEIDGPEVPGLDGSAAGFAKAIVAAGVVTQPARKPVVSVGTATTVCDRGATITVHPAADDTLRVSYVLDYGLGSPIPRQSVSFDVTPETFARDLADCRTFLLESEAVALKGQGVGQTVAWSDLLVFGPRGVIGNRLRHADEPARHKVLDLIGDLALSGCDLAGHVVAYRSGHSLNVNLSGRLATQRERFERAGLGDAIAAPVSVADRDRPKLRVFRAA
jgi:UDP-3-O-acyl N-acetylglucosamine deacetylase